ncbi:MAG: hypothetical protein NXI24_17315 [bacterium]|nr:hypothetical protein [bacterium]
MIFWRPAAPLYSATYYSDSGAQRGGEIFVALRTRYSEKRSLDPLAGTTDKRDYRSELARLEIGATDDRIAWPARAWIEFSGWILEDSTFRGPGPGVSLWWIGGENDEYGGRERALYFGDAAAQISRVPIPVADGQQAQSDTTGYAASESRDLLKAAVPSPSGRLMAILEEDLVNEASRSAPDRLRIVTVEMRGASTADGAASPGASAVVLRTIARVHAPGPVMSGPRWSADDSGVYIQTEAGIWFLTADLSAPAGGTQAIGSPALRRVNRYPACLSPRTNSGETLSPRGRRLYFDDSVGEFLVMQAARNNFFSFAGTPWAGDDADGSENLNCRP